jgi:N-acyl-L-homoserine lactone synthetase
MQSSVEPRTSVFPRGSALFDRVDYRLIETQEERDSVYLMRYRAYLHGGLISPSESRRVYDRYDDAPNVWIFGIFVDGELCGSFRLHVLTPECRLSYTTELFGDVLHERLDRGEVFIDPARFVADPETAQRFQELPYLTVRLAYLACDYFNADTGLAMVRTDHQAFYRRIFLSETIAGPRPFPGWDTKQVVLMASDFRNVREKILTRFPLMRSSAFERRMLFERGSPRKFASRPVLVSPPLNPGAAAS